MRAYLELEISAQRLAILLIRHRGITFDGVWPAEQSGKSPLNRNSFEAVQGLAKRLKAALSSK